MSHADADDDSDLINLQTLELARAEFSFLFYSFPFSLFIVV